MNEQFIRDRISILRTKKGISEYKMSLDMGHSKVIFRVYLPVKHYLL